MLYRHFSNETLPAPKQLTQEEVREFGKKNIEKLRATLERMYQAQIELEGMFKDFPQEAKDELLSMSQPRIEELENLIKYLED